MQTRNILLVGAAFAAGFLLTQVKGYQDIDLESLIKDSLLKGTAEIHNSRLALEQSNSTNIKVFAQRMIDDHIALNQQLTALAESRGIQVTDVEKNVNPDALYLLKFNSNNSFDEIYVQHQLNSHKGIIKLLRSFGRPDDSEIRDFFSKMLDQLSHHLKMAQELELTFHSNNIPTSSGQNPDFIEEPDYKI